MRAFGSNYWTESSSGEAESCANRLDSRAFRLLTPYPVFVLVTQCDKPRWITASLTYAAKFSGDQWKFGGSPEKAGINDGLIVQCPNLVFT